MMESRMSFKKKVSKWNEEETDGREMRKQRRASEEVLTSFFPTCKQKQQH